MYIYKYHICVRLTSSRCPGWCPGCMHAIYIYVYIYNTFFFSTGAREKQEHVEPSRHRIQMHSQASIRLALAQTCFIVETAGLSIYRHETWYLYMQALYIYTLAHLNSAGLSYIYLIIHYIIDILYTYVLAAEMMTILDHHAGTHSMTPFTTQQLAAAASARPACRAVARELGSRTCRCTAWVWALHFCIYAKIYNKL